MFAIIDDHLFDKHIPHGRLPERPARTYGIREALRKLIPDDDDNCIWITPVAITREDLELVHDPRYVSIVFNTCEKAENDSQTKAIQGNTEVLISPNSLRAILHAAGGAAQAVRLVLSSNTPTKRAFCNVRPPGHHARKGKGSGFCIFNNVWIAACEARKNGAEKVAIIDWDVHHGDGTQDFIIGHPRESDTLFFSIHQHHKTLWPGTGKAQTRGHHGTVNCIEMYPHEGDMSMKAHFRDTIVPQLLNFNPDIILISCGFDGHVMDVIANLRYTSELYGWMTTELVNVANQCCDGRMVSILEGGYCIPALESSVVAHIEEMMC